MTPRRDGGVNDLVDLRSARDLLEGLRHLGVQLQLWCSQEGDKLEIRAIGRPDMVTPAVEQACADLADELAEILEAEQDGAYPALPVILAWPGRPKRLVDQEGSGYRAWMLDSRERVIEMDLG